MQHDRATEVSEKENVKFDVICGDFNIDNLSPSDQLAAGNKLFSEVRRQSRKTLFYGGELRVQKTLPFFQTKNGLIRPEMQRQFGP